VLDQEDQEEKLMHSLQGSTVLITECHTQTWSSAFQALLSSSKSR
jgi:hypothetical protein